MPPRNGRTASLPALYHGPAWTPEGRRSIFEIAQAQFYDGGADGLASSAGDNTLFAVQGLFVP